MSHTPRRSRSKHGTPTPSRPGTPSGSHRRPSFVQQTSIPSLALANASLSSTVSAPQVSTSQAITISGAGNNNNDHPEQSSVPTSSNVSLYESTANESVLVDVRNDSNEQVHIVVEQTVGSSDAEGEVKAQDGVTLDANKLREQLRQSLGKARAQSKSYSQKEGVTIRTDIRDVDYDSPSQQQLSSSKQPTVHRQFFVLTHAGKPVFTNRSEDDVDAEDVTNLIGVMHALISVFEDEQDKIRSIIAPPTRITFTLRPPLYYACVTPYSEPESVARIYLEHLHLLVLSVLTQSQLERILTRHTNFDLRRLLSGTTTMLRAHLEYIPTSFAILSSSLSTLRLESGLRIRVADALVPLPNMKSRLKDILYAIVVVDDKVVTIARPKKHTVHPADMHVLLATIGSPAVRGSAANWLPICLPKYNSARLLHAYASYLQLTDDSPLVRTNEEPLLKDAGDPDGAPTPTTKVPQPQQVLPSICLVLVCASGDFETVRQWADVATSRLKENDTLKQLIKATQKSSYSITDLGIPGLRHFFYKSRPNVQVTSPMFEGLGESLSNEKEDDGTRDGEEESKESRAREEWEKLLNLYRVVWDAIHAKSGQECTLKLQYLRTDTVSVMGWITQSFEIYVALSPLLPKSAAIGAANAVVKYIKQEESRLFLRDAPVF
ncbi:Vacuolar fusion protein mon1 [Serendipita sp. 411]|nr:Vacuolar fusion protein mon1 [Serendipita sp. 400]KAG8855252.1 Vacuolar fusion protein mon1 [Serendipita sp. 411]